MLTQPLVVAGKIFSLGGKAVSAAVTPAGPIRPERTEPSVTATAAVTRMTRWKERIG
jgi:hypothetical protein